GAPGCPGHAGPAEVAPPRARAPRRQSLPDPHRPREHPPGPRAPRWPPPLHLGRWTRRTPARDGRRPRERPLPGLRDEPPDGARGEEPCPGAALSLPPGRAASPRGTTRPPSRGGGLDHGLELALRPEARGVAPHAPQEEYGRGLRQSELGRRGRIGAAGPRPGVVPDEDLPTEPRGRGRAGASALPEHRPQHPADADVGDGYPEASVLLHVAPRASAHRPEPGSGCLELRRDGRARGHDDRDRVAIYTRSSVA